MGLKTKIGMAMATSAAGAAMVVGGSFALFSSYAYTDSNTFTAGTVKIDVPGTFSAGDVTLSNMAPGDTANTSFTVVNNGSLDEWIALETGPQNVGTPGLFSSFANSMDASANEAGSFHGLGDQANGGSGNPVAGAGDFVTDNHPAQYSYVVTTPSGSTSEGTATAGLSGNDYGNAYAYKHPFLLRHGETATVTYTVYLPLEAHNDYQGLSGKLHVEVDAVQAKNNWYHTTGGDYSRQNTDVPSPVGDAWPFSWQPDVHQ